MAQKGLFDQQEREVKLAQQSQTLIELKSLVPWQQLATSRRSTMSIPLII